MLRHLATVCLVIMLSALSSANNKNIHYEGTKMAADMVWTTAEVTPEFMESVEILVGMLREANIITCPDSQFYIHGLKRKAKAEISPRQQVSEGPSNEYKFIFPIREPCRQVKAKCEIQMIHSETFLRVTTLNCENISWQKSSIEPTTAAPEPTFVPTEPEPVPTTQGVELTTDGVTTEYPFPTMFPTIVTTPEEVVTTPNGVETTMDIGSIEVFPEEPLLFRGKPKYNLGGYGYNGMFHYDAKVGKSADGAAGGDVTAKVPPV
jgi:hypothetical protein